MAKLDSHGRRPGVERLHPLVLGATAAAVLTALGSQEPRWIHSPRVSAAPAPMGVNGLPSPCASGTLPEGPVCLRIPGSSDVSPAEPPKGAAPQRGEAAPERIARRPERPAEASAYLFPVEGTRVLTDTGDLVRPGVRVAARPGEPVRSLALSSQQGPARVVFVGDIGGPAIVTAHVIEEASRKRTVLLLHEGLDHVAPALTEGAEVAAGAELGSARADLGGGLLAIYVEARELREGVLPERLDARRLADPTVSLPTDVRNVLPLR